jgi:quinol-cytochrome oxidoreductase complex cytochrome b subunit
VTLKGLRIYWLIVKKIAFLQTSKRLSYVWNMGRLLGFILMIQIISGLFLTFYYSNDSILAYTSVQYIIYEVNLGWLIRVFHFNGASLLFFAIYVHFFKGLFFFRYRLKKVWLVGLLILIIFMGVAFIGYVLVWAQIRFWACVVITRLITVFPLFGLKIVYWIWGGYSIGRATLKLFYSLHFLLPWFGLIFVILHLFFLHERGRRSRLMCFRDCDKINFYPYYFYKDLINIFYLLLFFFIVLINPFLLGDPEIFVEANPLVRPTHIVPEWYFLFAYAILRCIPNKLFGVLCLLMSLLIFFLFLVFYLPEFLIK